MSNKAPKNNEDKKALPKGFKPIIRFLRERAGMFLFFFFGSFGAYSIYVLYNEPFICPECDDNSRGGYARVDACEQYLAAGRSFQDPLLSHQEECSAVFRARDIYKEGDMRSVRNYLLANASRASQAAFYSEIKEKWDSLSCRYLYRPNIERSIRRKCEDILLLDSLSGEKSPCHENCEKFQDSLACQRSLRTDGRWEAYEAYLRQFPDGRCSQRFRKELNDCKYRPPMLVSTKACRER